MILKKYYPQLYSVLEKWREERTRPPLLIQGMGIDEWDWLSAEFAKIFLKNQNYQSFRENAINHPDVHILKRGKGEKTIGVDKARTFINDISLSPLELSFKVGFIPEADKLTPQTQNCLLKTLEEPISDCYLIIITLNQEQLLPTIISRSVILKLNKCSDEMLRNFIEEHLTQLSLKEVNKIIRWSGGEIGKIIDIAQKFTYWENIWKYQKNLINNSALDNLKKGNEMIYRNTEVARDFFSLLVNENRRKIHRYILQNQLDKAMGIVCDQKLVLDYNRQCNVNNGASPKLLLEAYLMGSSR